MRSVANARGCVSRMKSRAATTVASSIAALAPSPAGTSGKPTTTAPDDLFNIELTGRSRVEAFLDFRLQPGELFAATLLMRNCCDDCGLAAAIRSLAYLRGHEFLKSAPV
jgi:hypothetical protein